MPGVRNQPFIAIACGGTGGHLFPGLAVGEVLAARGCRVALLISPKDVDQQAVKGLVGIEVVTLPAVASSAGLFSFARGFLKSHRAAQKLFRASPPQAVLAMGGFTSAAPVLAGKKIGAKTFLHDSNTVPGRANRWLARWVHQAFVYFPETAARLRSGSVEVVGMPVRPQFEPCDAASARSALGLDPRRMTLLVMGGSQGAGGINDLLLKSLCPLAAALPELQFIHLTGANDAAKVQAAYIAAKLRAIVRPFLTEMDLAMAAASAAVSRSGASSLAETAAMRLPSILIPYPTAADDHQRHNALAFVNSGAARLLEQRTATPEKLVAMVQQLLTDEPVRAAMRAALANWHRPAAAETIAEKILTSIGAAELGAHSSAPFPLTPALSLRERGTPADARGNSDARSSVTVGGFRLPLPEGEGRGEGEAFVQDSPLAASTTAT